jgi:choline dehydrogenase-like flavoprotein
MADFDAIVVGSGITGGWAAKELTEKGLKVLLVERGRKVEHGVDYVTETLASWEFPYRGFGDPEARKRDYPIQSSTGMVNETNQHFFVKDPEHPYQTPEGQPFTWIRGYQLGGRSLTWGRISLRWSDLDFAANRTDGNGVDWPIRYADVEPWYDHVERHIGVTGARDGLPHLPDGRYQPPMALTPIETHFAKVVRETFEGRAVIAGRSANLTEERPGRSRCQYRAICSRGCSYGAYFSTQSSTLPAAQATGRLTVLTDTRVTRIVIDPKSGRATGVEAIDVKSRRPISHSAKLVFLCAGAFNSVGVLLNSTSEAAPRGLGNHSDMLGRGIMDHCKGMVSGDLPGFEDTMSVGNRPATVLIPRFRNLRGRDAPFLRGYGYNCIIARKGWTRGISGDLSGEALKAELRRPGGWGVRLVHYGECLPQRENRITLDPTHVDSLGQPQLRIDFRWGDNDLAMFEDARDQGIKMIEAAGGVVTATVQKPMPGGSSIHEMGGACMGEDPAASVTNGHNQVHGAPNLFVTDGSVMCSTAAQNPSLTYMALTARAADRATELLRQGKL